MTSLGERNRIAHFDIATGSDLAESARRLTRLPAGLGSVDDGATGGPL
jgi:hypothetical protein